MTQFSDSAVWGVRLATGGMLVLIGTQPISGHHGEMTLTFFPLLLPDTNVLLLDIMVRVMFIVFGLAIAVGIRTRLLAAFMLATTLLESIQCIQQYMTWSFGHVLLVVLVVGLSILIGTGGGRHSFQRGGWAGIPL